jgi:outer membrane receptor protein involved in Fe transport
MLAGICAPVSALAQDTAANEAAESATIVVTGSRIMRDGFSQPTPTTVMSTEDLKAAAVPNIADFVNQLPALNPTMTPTVNNAMTSGGTAGQNFLNLRGLGTNRTLVLMDGRRIVPTATSGSTDINNIPSQLVSRVDVVTGGASAAYGSDAVAGVVNFVLDSRFTGLKGDIDGGISALGDDEVIKGSLTFGTPIGERFHLLLSAMASEAPGIHFFDRKKRTWNTGTRRLPNPAFISQAATPNIPATLTFDNVNNSLSAAGGLITTGPARGIQFGVNGVQSPFEYGSPVIGTFMVGGQYGDTADQTTYIAAVRMATGFGRISYDVNDDTTAFVQFNYGYSLGRGWGSPQRRFGNVVIKSDNAFLPADVRALACPTAAANANCFNFGTDNADLAYRYDSERNMAIGGGRNHVERQTYVATAGLNGSLPGGWNWDVYYQFGRSKVNAQLGNNQISANYNKAVDAVFNGSGDIVCRVNADANPANDDPACAPLNIFGIGVASPEAKAYVLGTAAQTTQLTQQVAELTVSGDLVNLWAGPVSVAAGVGWRNEKVTTPFTDPLALAGAYFAANYKPTIGSYTVKEVFGEILFPLARGLPFAEELDLNGAVRMTDYSTSGTVFTYKAGVNYRPIHDILVRGTLSRDIRAPNLSELYSGGTTGLNPATDPRYSNAAISVPTAVIGNNALVPEIAKSLGIGAVYQPSWFPGFSASVDYYRINLNDAIANIGLQQVLNLCESGARPDFCSMIVRGAGTTGGVSVPDAVLSATVGPVNIASIKTSGFDVEFAYRKQLSDWFDGWDAAITLRALGTHISKFISNNGLGTVHDLAGETGQPAAGLPEWRWRTSLNYKQGSFDVTLIWRRISSGVFSNSFFDNSAGPLTVDNNRIKGADYFDLTAQYAPFRDERLELYASVKNLFNKKPPVVPHVASYLYIAYNPTLFDGIGTYFNVGARFKF